MNNNVVNKKVLWFVKFMILIFLISGCTSSKKQTPNIIYIMSDDHAIQAISAYGGIYKEVAPTPNIDKLAKEGVLFTNAFCTNSICGPSRASILTGKYSHKNGFYKNEGGQPFDNTQITFPKLLKQAGYTTAMIGKWHLWSEPTGFDYYKYHVLNGEQGTYWNPVYNENGTRVQEYGYSTNLTTKFALDWLKNKRDKSKPFCLLFQFKAPHRPWHPDSVYQNLFGDIEMPYPATFYDDYKGREQTAGKTMMTIENHLTHQDLKMTPPEGLTPKELNDWNRYGDLGQYISPSDTLQGVALKKWKYQRFIKDYLACVRSVDDNIGRLTKYLEEQGLADNTIIVYTGDQGFYLGDHGWYDKRFMYEESLRMPLIVRYPNKSKKNVKVDDMVLNIDFAPTLLDLAGVKVPNAMQGQSFMPLLEGEKQKKPRDAIYYHYYEYPKWHNVQPHYGVRTNRYKLIHFYYDVDLWELYDLKTDPHEMINRVNDPEYSEIVAELKDKMMELQEEYGDSYNIDEYRLITSEGMVTY